MIGKIDIYDSVVICNKLDRMIKNQSNSKIKVFSSDHL